MNEIDTALMRGVASERVLGEPCSLLDVMARSGRALQRRGKEYVFHQGEDAFSAVYVRSGFAMLKICDASGNDVFAGLLSPGDVYVEHDAVHPVDAKVIVETSFWLMPKAVLARVLETNPVAKEQFAANERVQKRRGMELAVVSHRHEVSSRLAALLLWLRDLSGAAHDVRDVHVPFSEAEMGKMLVSSREAICQRFSDFKRAGIVQRLTPRGIVRILDEGRLRELAEN